VCDPATDLFGNLPVIKSASTENRTWTPLSAVSAALKGQKVWVRARLQSSRSKGAVFGRM